ncbi:hypothetical protein EUGRSUZ_J02773 [Eucalyptus grandis]|uniref:Uncharacterized protein n=2 Tax=Eucalyptus grandis TaxID=71139 RepID=A0ACC3JA21_EUCGR|nr:hypothetical protein EUGRSUZ_J02773 [Eucalyptus grandis]
MEVNCFHSNVRIRVPESKELSWLLIRGRFETRALSPNTTYEVAFLVQLNRTDYSGRPSEVKLELHLPDGTKRTSKCSLKLPPQEKWYPRAGEFVMGPETVGTISFALQGTLDPQKTGLILKGVLIHPKD